MIPNDVDHCSFIDSTRFIESSDRESVVAYSFSEGIDRQYTLHDDPTYFVGWEVHIKDEGVGFIVSVCPVNFSGVRFEIQLQDGRILVVPFSHGGEQSIDFDEESDITFLQKIF
jgi:hypothetical protein